MLRRLVLACACSTTRSFVAKPFSSECFDYLRLNDERLLRQCQVDYRRDSGPGGQKRNKIESAVRLTHRPTAIVANAAEDRSQHRNKAIALKRLRKLIAYNVRTTDAWMSDPDRLPDELIAILPWHDKLQRIGRKNELRPLAEQLLLDVFDAHNGTVAEAVCSYISLRQYMVFLAGLRRHASLTDQRPSSLNC